MAAQAETHGGLAGRLTNGLIAAAAADVGAARERARRARLGILGLVLGLLCAWLWYRLLTGNPINVFQRPSLPAGAELWILPLVLILALGATMLMPLLSGRSPHTLFRPEQIDVGLDDVVGAETLVGEVTRTLNTFLAHQAFRDRLGGNPRRGILFEGPPGTGKTHLAKAMAREAGVPFLFISATSFQSMWYGASARRIKSYFNALRRTARAEGGAIGFIEEIDAIATARGGVLASEALAPSSLGCSHADNDALVAARSVGGTPSGPAVLAFASGEGAGGVVNELLVQMQSFDTPPFKLRLRNRLIGALNAYLPVHRQLAARPSPYANVLLIAATNRADTLDPALLRPGRFDKRLAFGAPARPARRALIDRGLSKRAHDDSLDGDAVRDDLAAQTFGATPATLERMFDEALVFALRAGREAMSWEDVQAARLEAAVGIADPVPYTQGERRRVAVHEGGHALIAWLSGTRRLEVLSIVKRGAALGLLAHGDPEETYTKTRSELLAMIDIAMGGMVAEQLELGESSTGPGSDLTHATQLACQIVGACGMAGSLVSFAAIEDGGLSRTGLVGRVLSDSLARTSVEELLQASRERVRRRMLANRHLLDAVRDALLDRDELIGEEIHAVFAAAGTPEPDELDLATAPAEAR